MVIIAPLKGFTYNLEELNKNGQNLITPPYDVINKKMQNIFYEKDTNNFIKLDYAKKLDSDTNDFQWHERAGVLLNKWIADGILVRSEKAAIYLMETDYLNPETNKTTTRNGIVCLLKLEELTEKSFIKPHEQTFSSHKIERLSLTKQTEANLSQIFGFFPDYDNKILNFIEKAKINKPEIDFVDDDGLRHKVWINTDSNFINILKNYLNSKKVYIADGHHRYTTALNYKNYVRENNKVPNNSVLDYLMVYLSPMSDPGLCILPTHRLLNYKDINLKENLKKYFEITEYSLENTNNSEEIEKKVFLDLKESKTTAYIIYYDNKFYLASLKNAFKNNFEDPTALSSLDVYILSNLIFKKIMNFTENEFDQPDFISYYSDIKEILEVCKSNENSTAFFLKATTVEDILNVSEINLVMPRKSTYFYPKVTTGLVINKIYFNEIVD